MPDYGRFDISNVRKASDVTLTAIEKAMATYLIAEDLTKQGLIADKEFQLFKWGMVAAGTSCTLFNFMSMSFYRYCKDKAQYDGDASTNILQYLNFFFASIAEGLPVLGVGLKDGLEGKFYAGCVAAFYRMVKVGTVDVMIADENACPMPLSSSHPALKNFYEGGFGDFFTATFPLLEGMIHILATGLCALNACRIYGMVDEHNVVNGVMQSNMSAKIVAGIAALTLGLLGGAAETMLQTLYDMRKVKGQEFTRDVLSASCQEMKCDGLFSGVAQLAKIADKGLIYLAHSVGYNAIFVSKMLTQAMMYQTALFDLMENSFGFSDQQMFSLCFLVTLTVGMKAGAGQFKSRLEVAEESWDDAMQCRDSNGSRNHAPLFFSRQSMRTFTPVTADVGVIESYGRDDLSKRGQQSPKHYGGV